ncbi:putative tannase subunit protein [Diplogelasinospora grovesii]|uniref:Carboxylic ester hydrolase n=1 Tax=Diplogelasinospora grovesii TaxID=303347 RepID=A0AAN6N284_9PEZI|nr:putative tannase subunit protein [Diplogelasinospora grovesii]
MRTTTLLTRLATVVVTGASTASLADVCTLAYVKSVLPADGFLPGVSILRDTVTVNAVTNYAVSSSGGMPGAASNNASSSYSTGEHSLCNITFGYTHPGLNDRNRYLSTGGGGFSITSGQRGLSEGLAYGAAAGTTDGGLGGWAAQLTDKVLAANGTLRYEPLVMFAYKAIHEMTVLGKQLTVQFYNASKVYSYYHGCSEGGREGLSQVQRYGSQFDGAAIGAPAIRFAFLQVIHLFSALVEITNNYFPSNCEMARIASDVLQACDALDGRADGVVSRTDLCRLHYKPTVNAVGISYSCAASSGGGMFGPPGSGGTSSPAANGTVSAKAAKIAEDIWNGLLDSKGRQAYVSFPPSASFGDAGTTYSTATKQYQATVGGIGVSWVNYFLKQIASPSLSLQNATYDTLRDWMVEGMQRYSDTLQTNWPDLEDFQKDGGKMIHYHGESDPSIPAGSSVMYHESVRKVMYPKMGYNESFAALNEWYRFYLVPGAGHCGASSDQPNGPFPDDVVASLIGWVERGVNPVRLNATVGSNGKVKDVSQQLCSWPLRPYWVNNGTTMDCVYDQVSIDTWLPTLDAIPVPVW